MVYIFVCMYISIGSLLIISSKPRYCIKLMQNCVLRNISALGKFIINLQYPFFLVIFHEISSSKLEITYLFIDSELEITYLFIVFRFQLQLSTNSKRLRIRIPLKTIAQLDKFCLGRSILVVLQQCNPTCRNRILHSFSC